MAKPLTDGINALTTYANAVTGASDTTLSQAVATLANGYGQGGGGDIVNFIEGTMTVFESDEITVVRHSGFSNYTNLTEISLPNCISLGVSAFHSCTNLTKLFLPKVENLSVNNAFFGVTCPLVLPSIKGTTYNRLTGFKGTVIDLGKGDYNIGGYTFNNCTNLAKIILRKETIPMLENANAVVNTPFKSGGTGGEIYIPKVLYDHLGDGSALDYKSATNWSTVDGYGTITWMQIEGSQYENYYADGTPIE